MAAYLDKKTAMRLEQPGLVDLYELKLARTGTLRFANDSRSDGKISFNKLAYECRPIKATGFAWGPLQDKGLPRLHLPSAAGDFTKVERSDQLIGAELRRIITLQTELDAPIGTGGGSCFAPESWEVLRIIRMDAYSLELELGPPSALLGSQLPNHQIFRDICQHRYRIWNAASNSFDYSLATCSYQGASYFDEAGKPTVNPAADVCSRRLHSGCRKRFVGSLPFFGFPGAAGQL